MVTTGQWTQVRRETMCVWLQSCPYLTTVSTAREQTCWTSVVFDSEVGSSRTVAKYCTCTETTLSSLQTYSPVEVRQTVSLHVWRRSAAA
jgi:hypothetical protein